MGTVVEPGLLAPRAPPSPPTCRLSDCVYLCLCVCLCVRLQSFSGLTNTLVGCCHAGDENSMLLFRLYGDGTDKFIDRDAEKRNMQVGQQRSQTGRPRS